MTAILLEAPGLEPLNVDIGSGYIVRRLDLGDAITRDVVQDAPDADGTIDTTQLTGARVVGLQVRLVPRNGFVPAMLERRLRAFTNARLRPVMTISRDGLDDQRVMLRRGPFSAPIEQPTFTDITVQWVAPLGILESAGDPHIANVFAVGPGAAVGRAYSLTFSRVYPPSPVLGSASIVNAGDADAYPLIRIYGPVTDPVLDNNTQDRSLAFSGLTLAADEFLEVDTRYKTIRLNGDPDNSRYDKLAFPTSQWWTLGAGVNFVRFHPATFIDGVTVAQLVWRDAFL